MEIIEHCGIGLQKDVAEVLAQKLNSDDEDGWKYVVKNPPEGEGFSFIEIYDEEDYFVGRL